ncbi:MAG: Zn-dependent hydrolase [Gammaproteobacteria bacterium]|nr:Zn-dependent hydrolase [Gammaproteobacteria bacterium]MDH3749094.1 Zn-dependent hydrolase [Gammaproteobacteria bacterium]MDH3805401.1 Zn-dependent hydrolase [Gammaproteobacteria bacterium]
MIPGIFVRIASVCLVTVIIASCGAETPSEPAVEPLVTVAPRPEIYAEFSLTADLRDLSDAQREMIGVLIEASEIMDGLFWRQAYGDDYEAWLATIGNARASRFADLNYGPWDRLDDEKPFIEGVGAKPLGANFYPEDMTKEEFDAAYLPGKNGLYSLIRRAEDGSLRLIPYHVAYADELKAAADLLRQAAGLAASQDFANYLKLRAAALISDDFQVSDLYWMDVKDNEIDVVIGPIETYEDRLFGYRAAYEAYVLIKDLDWSARLARFATFLPELQEGLPVPDEYKLESPGSDSDLNAYDVVYYAGHSNAGSKTIAINLPNDEEVQLQKGTRRLQLKNAMQAKFEKILEPIAEVLVDESQRQHITFDAFFANTMFHEVAHGLGIKNTITGEGTVREALLELASSMEEGKADILGLYMITELFNADELGDVDLRDYYVTFMAGVFRSIRFGASSAHGKANMVRFNFFVEHGAFVRDSETGRYRVDFDRMQEAITALSRQLLMLQGDGDYEGALRLTNTRGVIGDQLQADLDRLTRASIPVDITFKQGLTELGLE